MKTITAGKIDSNTWSILNRSHENSSLVRNDNAFGYFINVCSSMVDTRSNITPFSLAWGENMTRPSFINFMADMFSRCNIKIPLSNFSKDNKSFNMSTAVLQANRISLKVSHISICAGVGCRFFFILVTTMLRPKVAAFNGVRNSWEMYRTYDFLASNRTRNASSLASASANLA